MESRIFRIEYPKAHLSFYFQFIRSTDSLCYQLKEFYLLFYYFLVYIGWHSLCFLENSLLKVIQNNFSSPVFSRLNTHKSFHRSFVSYLVTFHFWQFPFLILSLPICHAVLVSESFLTWVFQSQRKNFLSPGLLKLKTWRPTRPFILSFSDQLLPCVRWWSFDSFFVEGLYVFDPLLVKLLESTVMVLHG